MQHATERVERPGESQEALDRKKEHAGEWLQLPVIEMPPLQSKEPFFMPANSGNSPLSKCH